ncbi:chondroitin sulfate proteoglycan 4-like [Lampris incognitus]|uniref:chondroitin sulfate proteoglycan 4-like n=1 Tax=Lampris incognitus TaxID=2546036 RepID=UPI0024B4C530|nr:chondroitin sulfate proteoglycan 4-like [Lampris incognitus]
MDPEVRSKGSATKTPIRQSIHFNGMCSGKVLDLRRRNLTLTESRLSVSPASFYGNSYIHLRTAEASNHTSLHIRFRTSRQSGLLFLAAGGRDFLLLELTSGQLQVRLDFGSGERSLRSEKGVHLSDLAWHSTQLSHTGHNVTLTVDWHSHNSLQMPGPDLELSLQEGLFVGGPAWLDRPFLHHKAPGFRGCLDEVVFNKHSLLSNLRPSAGVKSIHRVSLGCSSQFSATEDDPVGFFASRSFVLLPAWEVPQEGVFECELRPSGGVGDGVILFSATLQGGFVSMQIRDAHLVVMMGDGEGRQMEVRSHTRLHGNRMWYPVCLHLLPHRIQLRVGEELVNATLHPDLQAIQPEGALYLGGLDEGVQGEVRRAVLLSGGGGSFEGCLRNMRVNSQRTSLHHAVVSQDVSVGCNIATATNQPHADITTQQPITHHDTQDRKKNNFLLLRHLEVTEGDTVPLEPKHIKVNLDFRKLGLHPAQLMFHIEEPPVHGQIRVDLAQEGDDDGRRDGEGEESGRQTFSMLDLWRGQVMYVHGGSEDHRDFFTFSVFCSSKKELPAFLKEGNLHRFQIIIRPVNDPPDLSLPEGSLFILLPNSSRQLSSEVLRVSDPDSRPAELQFSCVGNLSTEAGHVEHREQPGRSITSFSLHDLQEGKIRFVHAGAPTATLALRVSDGHKLSNTVVLRILAVTLEQKLENNTGLQVDQGGASVISTNHLAVKVNVTEQAVEIHYDVVEAPRYGELQRQHLTGEWEPVSSFSQTILGKEQIRYLNTHRGLQTQNNATDHFKCRISIGSVATGEVVFRILVRWIHFKITRSKMEVTDVGKTTITPEHLHAISKGIRLHESDIFFRLLTLPNKGQLSLDKQVLKRKFTFSQGNITAGLLTYELLSRPSEDGRDTVSFQVYSQHADSASHDFRINIKARSGVVSLVNKGLSVLEGERKLITKDRLFAQAASHKAVQFTITSGPRHGQINKIHLSNSSAVSHNILTFTGQDIHEERVVYVHDDSESKQDSFSFSAAVYRPHKPAAKKDVRNLTEYTFNISIQLLNDQRPVRVVDKVFNVAREGQRLLTTDDLCYRDEDSDFEDGWLVYTRRGVPMGELVLANDTNHKLYEFTQRDLEQKKVLFIHRGVSFGRFVLFVSDGKHYVSTLLEVVAQDPYLQVENNTGLLVQRGGVVTLTSSNLSIFTNLDVREPGEVEYEVFQLPKHGTLTLDHGDAVMATDAVLTFTQQDLLEGRLAYHHHASRELSDSLNLTARVRERRAEEGRERGRREAHLDIGVGVKVFLESHHRPPTVLSKGPLVVEEGHNVSISREHLEVVHEESQPSQIIFSVQKPPSFGYLQKTWSVGERGGRQYPITLFTQEDINLGLVLYKHQEPGSFNDSVLLNATNGLTEVGPIRLEVDVVPTLLPLQVSVLILDEGSSLPLTSDIVKVTSHHFSGMSFLYQVIEPPRHGHLEHSRIPGMPITAFTQTELERQYISYIHDGSDTLTDNFTLFANQTETRKHSQLCTAHVHISPVNDETPAVTANRELKVWVGSVTDITPDDLSAEDSDTEDEDLEFIITPPSNGHLALKSAPSRHILNFTQKHIHSRQLVFVHSGALSGGFHFQVNDGVNFAPRQIFSIVAKPLVLSLQKNQIMEVYPGSVTAITQQELQAVTSSNDDVTGNRSVVFTVTTPPTLGRLVERQADNSTRDVSTFTQSKLNDGVILYDQNQPESVGWSAKDSFSFTVTSLPAVLPPHTFVILISYQANTHKQQSRHTPPVTRLRVNTGAVLAEGGRVVIDGSKLDASNLLENVLDSEQRGLKVQYRVILLPRHGTLSIGGQKLTRERREFTQLSLEESGIVYLHDDSETTNDSFSFQVWLAPLVSSSSSSSPTLTPLELAHHHHIKDSLVMEMFNITVTPVNDQPPLIRTRAPSMKVVVGESTVLGPENLQVEDHDTPPEELHYSVISKPSNGYLMLGERPEPVASFTQYDINHGRLHFVQQGEPSTGVFYFNVTDGYHRPLYKLFSLEVMKPAISMANNTGLSLLQGRTAVVLATNQLAAQTNGRRRANITYTVTAHPRHGRIAINDHEVTTFCHEDLQLGRVVYHMTDLSESEDSFEVSVCASSPDVVYGNLTAQRVNVTVRPLIYLRESVRVPSGVAVKLGKAMMDASELARISRADPVFEVLSPPKHGKLVKVTFNLDRASEVLRSFTFRDVMQGRVAIEETLSDESVDRLRNKSAAATTQGHAPATPLNDSFTFLLKSGNIQPAKGELHFTILPHHQMRHGPTGSHKADAAGRKHTPVRMGNQNKTSLGGRGSQRKSVNTHSSHPHILSHPSHNRTLNKLRSHSRWASNHTHTGGRGSGQRSVSHKPLPPPRHSGNVPLAPPHHPPVLVEAPPRPASDPLLIILPFLACLLLLVILVVLILVFRHQREKRARMRLIQQLAAVPLHAEGDSYLRGAERSITTPSVVVTPLRHGSCPSLPPVALSHRRSSSLVPGGSVWGALERERGRVLSRNEEWGFEGKAGGNNAAPTTPAGFRAFQRARSLTPTLRDSQYWV